MSIVPERDNLIAFTDVIAAMPEPVRARATFLRTVGINLEPTVEDVQRLAREGWSVQELAEGTHLHVRTIYRYLQEFTPCPGDRCLTKVQGGGLCGYCRRSA